MNLEELFLKRYTSQEKVSEGYYLRIRESETESSISRNIKVYYKGIKAFDLDITEKNGKNKEELSINSSVFVPNSVNVFENDKLMLGFEHVPSGLLGDIAIIDKYFKFEIGSCYQRQKGLEKIDFEFADAAKKLSDNELVELVKTVYSFFNLDLKRNVKLVDIVNGKTKEKTGHKIMFFLNKTVISFEELYSLKIKLLDGVLYKLGEESETGFNRYFKNVNLNLKCTLKDDILFTEEMLTFVEVALENRIKVYAGMPTDYKNTKSSDNQEKQMQQDFMLYLNRSDKEDIMLINSDDILYSREILPFEMEYVVYAGKVKDEDNDEELDEEEKRSSDNLKGRIDNTFVEGDTAVLVEIKYGTKVIDGSNGIHKHLIDLYSCLNMNRDGILKEYENRIKVRNKILGNNDNVSIKNIKYDIVCIYNSDEVDNVNLSRDAVKKKINEIYMKNCYKAGIKESDIKICCCDNNVDICKNVNCYCKNLLEMNVPQLIGMLKKEECSCDVRIILVDHEFREFEEYTYGDQK